MTSAHLKTWRCPECGVQNFWWHFEAPDGAILWAKLPVVPDMSGLQAAKETALAEYERMTKEGE